MTIEYYRFQYRQGTAADLAAVNEIPLQGEEILETDTRLRKTGDGVTHYNDLPYMHHFNFGATAGGVAVSANATVVADFRWRTAGVDRWIARKNGDAEAGANAGSNFEFHARADDGSLVGLVYTINRSTRVFDFKVAPTVNGVAIGGGGGGGSNPLLQDVNQVGHGLAVGDAIYLIDPSTAAQADGDDPNKAADAIVAAVADADNFTYALPGAIITLSGLTAGYYFLGSGPGAITDVEPVANVKQIIGKALDATEFLVIIGQAFNLSSAGLPEGEVYAATTWSPTQKSVDITLSGGNMIATKSLAGNADRMVLGTVARTYGGPWYIEYEIIASGASRFNSVGFGNLNDSFVQYMGQSPFGGCGYYGNDGSRYRGAVGQAFGTTFTTGDRIGASVHPQEGTVRFWKNGVLQGTTGIAYCDFVGKKFPALSMHEGSSVNSIKIHGARANIMYLPSGYLPWDGD